MRGFPWCLILALIKSEEQYKRVPQRKAHKKHEDVGRCSEKSAKTQSLALI